MRQYAGYGSAEESNRRYRYLLSHGTTGLSVAFDLPTQIGLDSDHPSALGEVGRVGVAIDSLQDMERLFADIPISQISTSMTINATAAILLALYLAVAKKQNVSPRVVSGTIQNDILKEYIARGTYIYPPRPSLRIVTDIFSFCQREMPCWNSISVSGYHIREAGSTAAQEIAFTLANAQAYAESGLAAGLEIDEFASQISFFFSANSDLLEEIAKFRAARRLWARLMRDRMGARREESWILRFHTQTAGSTLTAQQPDNNVVRVTLQALAAVLGGTQSLHTNARDEALALPAQPAAQLALRTQQILAHESGVADVADPLGGSWYVERLTSELEAEAEAYLERIRAMGGARRAVENGYMQKEIQQAAYEHQKRVEAGEQMMVGMNCFTGEENSEQESAGEILRLDPDVEKKQVESLQKLRSERDSRRVFRELQQVREAAAGSENLMPVILTAVECYATVGEIADAMREVFGEHREEPTLSW